MKRSRRKGVADPFATPPLTSPPLPTPPNIPFPPPPRSFSFPLSSRSGLALLIAVSASLALAYQQYRSSSSSSPTSPFPTALKGRPDAPCPPGLEGRCPVLVPHSPALLDAHPVLRAIGPYGLPALPYASPAAAYAYPLLVHETYVSQYDPRTRNPSWVIELLTPKAPFLPPSPVPSSPPSPPPSPAPAPPDPVSPPPAPSPPPSPSHPTRALSTFQPDPALLSHPTPALPPHYLASAYDRGHLVPAADSKASQAALDASFLLTNVSPQAPALNRRYWAAVEAWVRALPRRYPRVLCVTGTLWLPRAQEGGREVVEYEVIPRGHPVVAVPTHFFKVLVMEGGEGEGEGRVEVMAVVVPNGEVGGQRLTAFVTSVGAVEEATGWRLFPQLAGRVDGAEGKGVGKGRGRGRGGKGEEGGNVIEGVDLVLEAQGLGEVVGRGLTEAERRSVTRVCRDGGCDMGPFLAEMKRWEAVNRGKKNRTGGSGKGGGERGPAVDAALTMDAPPTLIAAAASSPASSNLA